MKFEPPPSPMRLARTSPEPSPCSSRNAAHPVEHEERRLREALGLGRGLDDVALPAPCDPTPMRRRLYLMRHAEVSYFAEDGSPVDPRDVPLNEEGIAQAKAVAEALAGIELDRVSASGLPRTLETASIVAPGTEPESWPELREIQGGRLSEIPADALQREFVHAFRGVIPNETRFLRGESIGELFDRVLPAVERLVADDGGTPRSPSSTAASIARSSRTRSPASGCSSATSSRRPPASTCSTSARAASGSCAR